MKINEKIQYLSTDKAFGILTRGGLEFALLENKGKFCSLYILDLENLHSLNRTCGYEKVNQKIQKIFKKLKNYDKNLIVGRIFSGDEICIVDLKRTEYLMCQLRRIMSDELLSFKNKGFPFTIPKNLSQIQEKLDSFVSGL
jgi:GGDEF domain-containing protein